MKTIKKKQLVEVMRKHFEYEFNYDYRHMLGITDKIYADLTELENDRMIKVQSIPDDTACLFNLRGMADSWEADDKMIIESLYKGMQGTESIKCNIDCLATFSELGVKDAEFYDIRFENGLRLYAVSGYHLERVNT